MSTVEPTPREILDCQEAVTALYQEVFEPPTPRNDDPPNDDPPHDDPAPPPHERMSDDELIDKAMKAKKISKSLNIDSQ